MNTTTHSQRPNSPFADMADHILIRALRPLTNDGQVMWIRLAALMLSLFFLVGLIASIMFGPLAGPATAFGRMSREAGWAIDPPATRIGTAPTEPIIVTGSSRVEPSTPKRMDTRPVPDPHVDPLEDVGIAATTPKDPHIDPLEDVGIAPTPAPTGAITGR